MWWFKRFIKRYQVAAQWGLIAFCVAPLSVSAWSERVIRIVSDEATPGTPGYYFDNINQYRNELLALAIEKSGDHISVRYVLEPNMAQSRHIKNVQQGKLDLMWTMTSREREQQLRPIRIPLYKGLVGWRISFIHPDSQKTMSELRSLSDFKGLVASQGRDWPDTEILKSNGIDVVTSAGWEARYKALSVKRFDFFPRAVTEIWSEQKLATKYALAIEQSMVLQYPSASYFFVKNEDESLALTIERGLNIAIEDGSFDALFNKFYGELIAKAKLHKRNVIRLVNPLLPAETPLDRKKLWFDVD